MKKEHAATIRSILNEALAHSTALYDYQPRGLESMSKWFEAKHAVGFPVMGAVSPSGERPGFAGYGTFHTWPAHKYSVEHSVYVHKDHRGEDVGRALMERLIARATEQQFHTMIGGFDASNEASIKQRASAERRPRGVHPELVQPACRNACTSLTQ